MIVLLDNTSLMQMIAANYRSPITSLRDLL